MTKRFELLSDLAPLMKCSKCGIDIFEWPQYPEDIIYSREYIYYDQLAEGGYCQSCYKIRPKILDILYFVAEIFLLFPVLAMINIIYMVIVGYSKLEILMVIIILIVIYIGARISRSLIRNKIQNRNLMKSPRFWTCPSPRPSRGCIWGLRC